MRQPSIIGKSVGTRHATRALFLVALGLAHVLSSTAAHAQSSTSTVTYQGVLTQNGAPVADGSYMLTFKVYDAASEGNVVETIEVPGVQITRGRFTAFVPVTPSTFNGFDRWWSVTFNSVEMLPRQMVTATPYATSATRLVAPSTGRPLVQLTNDGVVIGSLTTPAIDDHLHKLHVQAGDGDPTAVLIRQNWVFNDASEPRQFAISGFNDETDYAYPVLGLGVHTLRNYAAISVAGENNTRRPLALNPVGGGVAINTTETNGYALNVSGTTATGTLVIRGGADVAEPVSVTQTTKVAKVLSGMVMVIDRENDCNLVPCSTAYDRAVAGVISGANGLSPGMVLSAESLYTSAGGNTMPLAMTGRVWVLCDASHGPIRRGDALTTSTTPGYAMVVTDDARATRAVIGKAMTELKEGKGIVLVLVNLQ